MNWELQLRHLLLTHKTAHDALGSVGDLVQGWKRQPVVPKWGSETRQTSVAPRSVPTRIFSSWTDRQLFQAQQRTSSRYRGNILGLGSFVLTRPNSFSRCLVNFPFLSTTWYWPICYISPLEKTSPGALKETFNDFSFLCWFRNTPPQTIKSKCNNICKFH